MFIGIGLGLHQSSSRTRAAALLSGETDGIAFDFTDASIAIKDTGTPANEISSIGIVSGGSFVGPGSRLTYAPTSSKICLQSDGSVRRVAHNVTLYSEDFSNAAWGNFNLTTKSADTLVPNATNGQHATYQSYAAVVGATYQVEFEAKPAGLNYVAGSLSISGGAELIQMFNLSAGTVASTYGAGTVLAASIEDAGDGWFLCKLRGVANNATIYVDVFPHVADANPRTSWSNDAVSGVNVRKLRTYRYPANTDYVKTTSAAKYALPYTYSSGSIRGILAEWSARTNICLRSNDLTNASWTKSNMSTAQTATGADGISNSATTLTASAANATALQAITSASAERVTSVYIKRRTGTGNIDLTQDNGSTWTTQAVTSTWARYELSAVTSANPTVGIRIVTSGDAVDVMYFQHEVGSEPSSPIVTHASPLSRAADSITIASTGYPHSATVNSGLVQYVPINVASAAIALKWSDGTANEVVSLGHDASAVLGLTVTDGGAAQTAPLTDGTATKDATETLGFSWKANDFLFSDNGAAAVADTSGTLPTVTTLHMGGSGSVILKKVLVVPVEKTAAEVAAYGATS